MATDYPRPNYHALMRYQQRYGRRMSQMEYNWFCAWLRNNAPLDAGDPTNHRTRLRVDWWGQQVHLVWDYQTSKIVTFLPL